jgi:DNA-binding XRE family transcriptional regulator
MGVLQGMISFESQGSFSVLTVRAGDPYFAKDLNKVVLDELQSLNRYFKSQHLNEKTEFIKNRIESVGNDLKESEITLKIFREQNRQISSPALQLELEHLSRDVEIQKGIYLTLKQQQELAKIEEVEKTTIVQVLDEPQIPLSASNKNLTLSVLLAGILGIGLGIMIGFVRAYADNSDMEERKKLRRVKHLFKKKIKDIFQDRRILGIVSILLLTGLPLFLGYKSKSPVFFGMYSAKLMLVNTVYILALLFFSGLFIYFDRKND